MDWEHAASNGFLLVSQFSVRGALYPCRPHLVAFVNGLPLVLIESDALLPAILDKAFEGEL